MIPFGQIITLANQGLVGGIPSKMPQCHQSLVTGIAGWGGVKPGWVSQKWSWPSKGSSSKMKLTKWWLADFQGCHTDIVFFWGGPGRYREKTIIGHHFFCTKDLRQLHRRYIFCEEMLNKDLWNFIKSQSLAKGLYKRRPGFMSPRVARFPYKMMPSCSHPPNHTNFPETSSSSLKTGGKLLSFWEKRPVFSGELLALGRVTPTQFSLPTQLNPQIQTPLGCPRNLAKG